MISPGAKNWIKKYFSLVREGRFSLSNDLVFETKNKKDAHTAIIDMANQTGLTFGIPVSLLFTSTLKLELTEEERLKLLLFESLLEVYLQNNLEDFEEDKFIESIYKFYAYETEEGNHEWFSFFYSKDKYAALERFFANRIKIKSQLNDTNYWLNHLSNNFVFLDVILFKRYLEKKTLGFAEHYEVSIIQLLKTIVYVAKAENNISKKENRLIEFYIAAADVSAKKSKEIKAFLAEDVVDYSAIDFYTSDLLLSHYTFELAAFILALNEDAHTNEQVKLDNLGQSLGLNQEERNAILWQCKEFLTLHRSSISFLQSNSETKLVYTNLSKRYLKLLGRSKGKFLNEMRESKELIALVKKSTHTELTAKEKEMVKSQFKDILKSMPSLAIFMLPGGALLLPIILKLVPDLLPSAFKENDVEV